ncbi:MAG: hypothetical protein ABIS26_01195, partial [Candidatus Paceibacterota bacterium]
TPQSFVEFISLNNFKSMADVNKLKEDVAWWTEEVRMRQQGGDQEKVREAIDMLKQRQDELMQAEREESK